MAKPDVSSGASRRNTTVINDGMGITLVERTWKGESSHHEGRIKVDRPDIVPIVDKWIYVFFHPGKVGCGSPQLIAEIWATETPGVWQQLVIIGKGQAPTSKSSHLLTSRGQYPPEKGEGAYYFTLFPLQLTPAAIDQLTSDLVGQVKNRPQTPAPLQKGQQLLWYNSIDDEPYLLATPFQLDANSENADNIVWIVDPFAWEQDIHTLGLKPALERLDAFRSDPERSNKRFVARALASYIEADEPDGNITGWTQTGSDLMRVEDFPMPPLPEHLFDKQGGTKKRQDSPRACHKVQVPTDKWNNNPGPEIDNVAKLWLFLDLSEETALGVHANGFVQELAEWLRGPRHKIADIATEDKSWNEGEKISENLCHGVAHYAVVLDRLAEFAEGRRTIEHLFSTSGDRAYLPKKLFEFTTDGGQAETIFEKYKSKFDMVTASVFFLLEHLLPRELAKNGTEATFKLCSIWFSNYELRGLNLKKITKTLYFPDGSKLEKETRALYIHISPETYEKFAAKIDKWAKIAEKVDRIVEPTKTVLSVLNALFATYSLIEKGPKDWAEVAKLFLSYGDVALTVSEAYKQYHAVKLGEEGLSKALQSRFKFKGNIVGGIGALIDFHIELNAAGDAQIQGNTGVAIGHILQAMGAASGVTLGVYSVGAFVAGWTSAGAAAGVGAISGPIGWIALIGIALTAIGTVVVKSFQRTPWEDFANHCFLGNRDKDYGEKLPIVLGGPTATESVAKSRLKEFHENFSKQAWAARALLARFEVEVLADGTVSISPGITGRDVYFIVRWEYPFYRPADYNGPEQKFVATACCYPYYTKAIIFNKEYINCNPTQIDCGKDCWVGYTNAVPQQPVDKGGSIGIFRLRPRLTGSHTSGLPNFKLFVRMSLQGASQLAQSKKDIYDIEDYRWIPREKALEIDMTYGVIKTASGAYLQA